VEKRGGKQMVMIGYSDSNKDSGFAAARWALQHAQVELAAAVAEQGIELQLFHGRGGTLSRGGGKTHNAVLTAPPGTVKGRLRVTEQGEIINEKYGLRGIALRTLEQTTGSVALVTALPEHRGCDAPDWDRMMQVIADASRQRYRELVYETPRFYEYFRNATPVDLIEQMRISSRPSSRRGGAGVAELRAIPWVFAWTQSRFILPGWYGLGSGLKAAAERFPERELSEMFREWYFARLLVSDAERVLAQADLTIACFYSELAGELHEQFFPLIRKEFELTRDMVLEYTGQDALLENDPTLQRSIMLRNPYVDPMSLMQVDLLARWRKGEHKDGGLLDALFASVNGIAQGLQNTG
jgi:phosphoenolpyruvate carboxylase